MNKKINARTISLVLIFILILITIALLIGKFTYSYLAPTIDDDVEGAGEVTASGDTIIFTKGNTLSLSATTDNFKTNGGNLTATTNPKVKLMASSKTESASSKYFAGVIIKNNTYRYTTTDKKPEVILTVKDENGNIVETSSDNLKFVTVNNNLKGFDITGVNGAFNIVTDHVIATASNKSEVIHTWTFTLTFVNLGTDQSENENSTLNIDVVLQKDKIPTTIADVCSNNDKLSDCVINSYEKLGLLYHHDSTLANGAEDDSYRYAGAIDEVNNYICLGSNEATCSDDNLYRIIGVFGENNHGIKDQQLVKVIKNTSIGDTAWNSVQKNDWASASLKTTLNSTFKTEKLSGFEDKIAEVIWRVSGYSTSAATAKTVYTGEITNATTTVTAKIGLMYPSDYGFATTQDYWTTNLSSYDSSAKNKDWLYLGSTEWLLSPSTNFSFYAWYVRSIGSVGTGGGIFVADTNAVRPTFFLTSSVQYISGSGTSSDPIRAN